MRRRCRPDRKRRRRRVAVAVARALAWVAGASAILGVLDLVSTLLCIRLWVSTADFGAATLAIALFPILDRLGGLGLGAALVREPSPESEASVFWLALGAAGALTALLVAAHPLIARAFGQPIVASLLAAYAARGAVQAVVLVPEARMRRALRFDELSAIRVIAGGCETATKLGLAYAGAHGEPALRVWCFAAGPIAGSLVTAIGVQLREPWRPRLSFARAAAWRAARFTAALSGGELLYYAYTSADYLVVGACFGDAAVGAYRLAYELVVDVVRLVSMITAEVAYPVFVRATNVRDQLVRFTQQNAFALAPILVAIAVEADDLLALLYGALPPAAALAARILCIVGALRVLSFVIPPMLAAIGEPRRALAYHAIALVVLPAAFAIGGAVGRDVTAVAWAWAIGYPIAFAALLALALPRAHLSLAVYLRALRGVAICALGAAAAGIGVRALFDSPWRALPVCAAIALVYALLLARLEGVTPRSLARSFAAGRATAATAPARAPSPDT